MRILLVEDDNRIARDLITALEASGYVVEHESDGEEAWFKGDTENYDAAILDLGLPGMDGLVILKRWRETKRAFPVLVLTARGTWRERVEGIDAGADDYLPKPFQMDELLARLRAIIRRSTGQSSDYVEIGSVALDTRQMRITVYGAPVNLSPQEYRLVSYLMHHAGRVVTQQELTEHIYAQDFERDSNVIEVLVGRARKKLGVDLIETRRGFGYIIEAPGSNA
jgi:DNA-binding response OmpR family regulator